MLFISVFFQGFFCPAHPYKKNNKCQRYRHRIYEYPQNNFSVSDYFHIGGIDGLNVIRYIRIKTVKYTSFFINYFTYYLPFFPAGVFLSSHARILVHLSARYPYRLFLSDFAQI